MKSKKRTPKPVTLLTKIETLLSDVLQQCSEIEKSVEKNALVLLRAAEASVAAAKNYFITPEPPKIQRKSPRTVAHVVRHRVTRRRAKAAIAAKKRPVGRAVRKVA